MSSKSKKDQVRPERGEEARKPEGRPERVPMGNGNQLSAPKRDGYQRYWAKEGPTSAGMLDRFIAAYWDFVLVDGKKVTRPGGKGDTHYLMEIKQKYYDEDMAAQQARNIETTQGKVQHLGEKEYVPMGRKSVVERDLI